MANTLITLQQIARKALPRLSENLVFPKLIYRDFSNDFHDVGDTVLVRRPTVFRAEEFDETTGVNYQDMIEQTTEVKLDHIATVDARASAIESAVNIDDLDRIFIAPAAAALAEKINTDGLKLYRDIANSVGTAGETPATLEALSNVRRALNRAKVPQTGRVAVWDTEADAAFTQLPALVNAEKSGSTLALREGSIGRVFGVDHYMSQAVPKHISMITAAENVRTAAAVNEGDLSVKLSGTALTGAFVKGDLIIIGGVSYAVAKDSGTISGNSVTVHLTQPLPQLASGTAVTVVGAHTANLAFHPMAFAYVTRPLVDPDGQGVMSYVTNYGGISLRVTKGYDQRYKRSTYSMDVLYGYKTVYPELAVRVLG